RHYFALVAHRGTVIDGSSNLGQILMIGNHNGIDVSQYSARIAFGGVGHFVIAGAPRQANSWMKFQIKVKTDTVDWIVTYPNGNVVTATQPRGNPDDTFDSIVIGSGLGNGN